MNILITGGAGYLGQILVPLLQKNHNVIVIDNLLYGQNKPKIPFIKGDISSLSDLSNCFTKKIDVVIHLAALVGDEVCKLNSEQAIKVNKEATKLLCDICKKKKVKKFIFASTCSVYGYSEKELTEKSKTNTLSLYAQSKLDCEKILKRYSHYFNVYVLRFGTLFGYSPRMRFDLVANTMISTAVNKGKVIVNGGSQFRPLLYVKDAAKTIIRCIEKKNKGFNLYNVVGENWRVIDIASKITSTLKAKIITTKKIVDLRHYRVSNEKIKKEFFYIFFQSLSNCIGEIAKCKEIKQYLNKKYHNVKYKISAL